MHGLIAVETALPGEHAAGEPTLPPWESLVAFARGNV